jgi:hypothetical protein
MSCRIPEKRHSGNAVQGTGPGELLVGQFAGFVVVSLSRRMKT